MKPRLPRPGVLRRERRALLETRADALQEVGGQLVEMYRRGKFRRDVLSESCAAILGIDTRLAEINDLLQHRGGVPRCECGSPVFRGTHFCEVPGAPVAVAHETTMSHETTVPQTTVSENTVAAPPPLPPDR